MSGWRSRLCNRLTGESRHLWQTRLLHYLHTLTGIPVLDGSMGVTLGLYICSHPAANAVDMLFFERYNLYVLFT